VESLACAPGRLPWPQGMLAGLVEAGAAACGRVAGAGGEVSVAVVLAAAPPMHQGAEMPGGGLGCPLGWVLLAWSPPAPAGDSLAAVALAGSGAAALGLGAGVGSRSRALCTAAARPGPEAGWVAAPARGAEHRAVECAMRQGGSGRAGAAGGPGLRAAARTWRAARVRLGRRLRCVGVLGGGGAAVLPRLVAWDHGGAALGSKGMQAAPVELEHQLQRLGAVPRAGHLQRAGRGAARRSTRRLRAAAEVRRGAGRVAAAQVPAARAPPTSTRLSASCCTCSELVRWNVPNGSGAAVLLVSGRSAA
jgi:hypothetical protein